MPTRTAVPLHKKRQAKFIEAAQDHDNPDKSITSLLNWGTGARNITVGHIHADWFFYEPEEDALYIEIPAYDDCRKNPDSVEACGDCRDNGHDHYEPKTPAGKDRIILITNHYHNHNEGGRTGKKQYLGLRDMVEQYFALSDPHAPPEAQYGKRMIGPQGNGISRGTVNNYIRDIAAESGIKSPLRAKHIRSHSVEDEDDDEYEGPVKDWGRDNNGNQIPDLFSHDLRASYCTQLMRNEVPPQKAVNKTGHKDPDSLKPYVMLAANEIDAAEEEEWL
jgi:hypothetical protein